MMTEDENKRMFLLVQEKWGSGTPVILLTLKWVALQAGLGFSSF
jgi:hypothetical protein